LVLRDGRDPERVARENEAARSCLYVPATSHVVTSSREQLGPVGTEEDGSHVGGVAVEETEGISGVRLPLPELPERERERERGDQTRTLCCWSGQGPREGVAPTVRSEEAV